MKIALVLGRATGVWDELAAAKELIGTRPRIIIATKRAGRDYDGPVHEWPSFHPELFSAWIAERARHNRPPAQRLWSARSPKVKRMSDYGHEINWLDSVGGSSGLLGVQVGFAVNADRMILCGIPMERSGRYDDDKVWTEAEMYRDHWIKYFEDDPSRKDRVRSMSGWTMEQFGFPDLQWLREPEEYKA